MGTKGLSVRSKLTIIALLAIVGVFVGSSRSGRAFADTSASLTPGPGAMTIYSVTNPNSTPVNVQHVISDGSGFNYSFWSQVPAGGTAVYHLESIPQIPSPFQGTLNLYGNQPFAAQIVGYDYPTGSLQPRVWLPVVTKGS